jgi:preprotein translocase SecE subunit
MELKKVNWISLKETQQLTLNVILFSLLFVIIYGILDFLFSRLILIFR